MTALVKEYIHDLLFQKNFPTFNVSFFFLLVTNIAAKSTGLFEGEMGKILELANIYIYFHSPIAFPSDVSSFCNIPFEDIFIF
jgi:hypothetical protein